jgi:hypothetical protein
MGFALIWEMRRGGRSARQSDPAAIGRLRRFAAAFNQRPRIILSRRKEDRAPLPNGGDRAIAGSASMRLSANSIIAVSILSAAVAGRRQRSLRSSRRPMSRTLR